MKNTVFTGAATALITPTDSNGVNYEKFGALIDWQITQGIDALVICGTSGESSTLSEEEHCQVVEYAARKIDHRVPMIAGTGSNSTDTAIKLSRSACESGADAVLVVTPYYNKATQNGLVQMYSAIADASAKPVIIYDVPSRTGVSIEPLTYSKLAKHPNIVAIKEANGNISKIAETMALVGDQIDLYSGNDDQIVPIMALGGKGVISVLSNVIPAETHQMCEYCLNDEVRKAAELQLKYMPLINALFSEVNPIPVKAAMAKMGFCDNYLRLPLTQMEKEHENVLFEEMKKAGIRF